MACESCDTGAVYTAVDLKFREFAIHGRHLQ
jgi:hypothetical protein